MKCNYKRNLKNTAETKLTKEQEKAIAFYLDMYSFLLKEYYDEKNKRLKNEEDFFNSFYQLIIDENQHDKKTVLRGILFLNKQVNMKQYFMMRCCQRKQRLSVKMQKN